MVLLIRRGILGHVYLILRDVIAESGGSKRNMTCSALCMVTLTMLIEPVLPEHGVVEVISIGYLCISMARDPANVFIPQVRHAPCIYQ